ncbi:MAG TPA: efflux RND transporter permease subunit, partial [Anaerolineae bacterium]|nr:efflux RND transporter permease subunit [Anaerolineae bacterium]
ETFKQVEQRYRRLLNWALVHRKTVIFTALGLFIISVFLTPLVGVELMPTADEGEVQVTLETAVGSKLEIVDQVARTAENLIRQHVPEMRDMFSNAGGGGMRSSGGHTASINVELVPQKDRKRSSEQIANDLRRLLTGLPGVTVQTRAGQGMFMMRMSSTSSDRIIVEVRGYDLEIAQELAQKVQQAVERVPGITDTNISRQEGSPEQIIRINRQKAADLGLTVTRIGNTLQTAIGGSQASNFRERGKEYRILVRLSEEDRKKLDDLLDLVIVNNRSEPVILRNVVDTVPLEGPVSLERKDQERIITINANFTGRDMGSIISDIQKELRSVPVSKDFTILFGGDYEEQQKAFHELLFGLILAIFLVYMVMAGQFESFRDPFIILFSIPMALIGIVTVLVILGTPFSMQGFIGCIMLGGIVVNNAILLVDYTNRMRRTANMTLMEAISLAGSRRLRPILMTTLTTGLGLFPLSLGLGEGGEAQAPLARVVIGGLLSSALITLVLIPVVYSIFEQKRESKKILPDNA